MKRANQIQPQNPKITFHLAQALNETGDRSAARNLLKQLLASGRQFDDLENARKLQGELHECWASGVAGLLESVFLVSLGDEVTTMIEGLAKFLSATGVDFGSFSTVFDIGSRDARQAVQLSKLFANATVVAIECNPETLDQCRRNVAGNERIKLVEKAVNSYTGRCRFFPIDTKRTVTTWTDGNPGASFSFRFQRRLFRGNLCAKRNRKSTVPGWMICAVNSISRLSILSGWIFRVLNCSRCSRPENFWTPSGIYIPKSRIARSIQVNACSMMSKPS